MWDSTTKPGWDIFSDDPTLRYLDDSESFDKSESERFLLGHCFIHATGNNPRTRTRSEPRIREFGMESRCQLAQAELIPHHVSRPAQVTGACYCGTMRRDGGAQGVQAYPSGVRLTERALIPPMTRLWPQLFSF